MLSTDVAALRRAALAFDVVRFVAACPACGADAIWDQQREDTRLRTVITCAEPACGDGAGPEPRPLDATLSAA
jgi:hypothetical protein